MLRPVSPRRTRLILGLLVIGSILPQATVCTIDAPPGSTIVVDAGVALVVADLIRDIVFITEFDDDYFDDHHHDGFFFDYWW